jgi:pimeloyl-ACP methyl ester carboxylesterase
MLVIVYVLGAVYLYFFQRSFIYFPTKKIQHNALVDNLKIDNENIKVIVLNPRAENAILYFGGRSESVEKRIKKFKDIFPSSTIYMLSYRGYGESSGKPSEKNLYNDATFLYKKIAKQHKDITVIGRSLGTGIATYIASTLKVKKMILVTPYDSILKMAQDKYPFYPIRYILEDQYNSIHRVENIKVPTLILLASHDETIPASYSYTLIDKFNPTNLSVLTLENTGHNTIIHKEAYFNALKDFVED